MNVVKHVQPVPKRKKGAPQRQSLHDALECLSHESLRGFLDGSTIWILPSASVSSLLDDCCLGTLCSSDAMKQDIIRVVQASFPVDNEGDRTASLLRLSLEEGFFLAYALGVLTIHNIHENTLIGPVGLQELWRACCSLRSTFWYTYIGYHHYRSKGWAVRSGLLYGVDFVLYPGHPSGVHSDCCILILPDNKPLLWTDLQVCNRLSSQVGKELVLLYISYPAQADFSALAVLDDIQVEERLVSRWIPEKEMTRL